MLAPYKTNGKIKWLLQFCNLQIESIVITFNLFIHKTTRIVVFKVVICYNNVDTTDEPAKFR